MVVESQVKYYIFTKVLDYLLAYQWYCGIDAVSVSSVMKWLSERGTYGYMWGVTAAQADLWFHELVWLKMISFDEEKQKISLTEKGYEACQDQRFHSIYASLLEAKRSRHIATLALIIAFLTAIITIIGLLFTCLPSREPVTSIESACSSCQSAASSIASVGGEKAHSFKKIYSFPL